MKGKLKRAFAICIAALLALPASLLIGIAANAAADPATPDTSGLYGGSISWVEVLDLGESRTRVFVSTQSANSIFYADIDHTEEEPFADVVFQVVPDMDADAGYGEIWQFAVDAASGYLYFPWWPPGDYSESDEQKPGIYKCTVEEGSIERLEFESEDEYGPGLGWVNEITIHDGNMLFVENTWDEQAQHDVCQLRFGAIDATTGDFTESANSPVSLKDDHGGQMKAPVIHPVTDNVYILDRGEHWGDMDIDSAIYKSSDPYTALDSETTFTQIVPPTGSEEQPRHYESLGIAPDGVLYLAGWQQTQNNYNESIAIYSTNDGQSWVSGTRDEYCWAWQGPNFAFLSDGAGGYDVVTGTMVSDDGGDIWGMLPRSGNVWPHPGAIDFDPNADNTFYVQTDRGVAVTADAGYSFSRAWERPEHTHIEDIEVIDLSGSKSGIFIKEREWSDHGDPDNPIKVYYAEIDHSGETPVYGDFAVVPGMGDGTNWEIWSRFTSDSASGYIFFEGTPDRDDPDENGLYKTDGTTAPAKITIDSGYASRPLIVDGHMFYVDSSWGGGYWVDGYWIDGYWEGDTWVDDEWVEGYWVEGDSASKLYYGTLDAGGNYTAIGDVSITGEGGLWPERMIVSPADDTIYIMSNDWQTGAQIYKSSDAYDEIDGETTFEQVGTPSDTDGSYHWQAFGIGPDGQLYLGGWEQAGMGGSAIAYSENGGDNWETVSLDNDYCGIGEDFAFIGDSEDYDIFCGTMVSKNKGIAWENLPRRDADKAYPNSSCIQIDPNDPDVLYIPTSRGMGYSPDAGYHFYEISRGIEAVHIKDLALDPETGNGWAVASSGVYRVSDMDSDPVWSAPMDPHGEGATYNTVDMDLSDPTGNTVYVGTEWGDRIFKTTDGGESWKSLWRPQPQPDPSEPHEDWTWANWCGNVSNITVDPYNTDRIFIGYDTGWWGWGENQEQRVFGQLFVYEEGSADVTTPEDPWMHNPWDPNRDMRQIFLERSEEEATDQIENNENGHTWYSLKGDMNVHDILITQEEGETVIYVAASHSDETVTPIEDDELIHNGLYDSYGYPLIYKVYRLTGDVHEGFEVEVDFTDEDTEISSLAIDSAGNVYGCGKDYDEATYESFLARYRNQARQEMIERDRQRSREDFRIEARRGLYDELVHELFDEGEGFDPGYMGDWDGHFYEVYDEFVSTYFADYAGELNDEFKEYYEESFDTFFDDYLLPEFDRHYEEHADHFDDYWDHNKPQQGLRIVYKRDASGTWTALPFDGLNKAFNMHWGFDHNSAVITIGQDPFNSEAEVPYVAFNRFIYYMPDGYNDWVLGTEYPLGTEIYVIIGIRSYDGAGEEETPELEEAASTQSGLMSALRAIGLAPQVAAAAEDDGAYLYVGTGTGIYGQFIPPSDDVIFGGPGSNTWLIVAGVIGGIAAAGGVAYYLKRNVF